MSNLPSLIERSLRRFLYVSLFLLYLVNAQDTHIVVFKKVIPVGKSGGTGLPGTFNSSNLLAQTQAIGDFRWFQGEFAQDVLLQLQGSPEVEYVLPDVLVHTCDIQSNPPSWGLDRIDQPEGTDGRFHYPNSSGDGVTIYLIDTGVNINHQDFEGRATWGPTFNGDADGSDVNGHGSFVAGVAIGKNFGVAKKAKLVSIKALNSNGSGKLSDVLKGVRWIVEEHTRNSGQRSIINLSLSSAFNQAANDAIGAAIDLGIHFAIAAGNDKQDACKFSPASVKTAVVVGALDKKDQLSSFSNFGSCVTMFAPGVDIRSTWNSSDTATHQLSGTSMAAPHVSGTMALILGEQNIDPASMISLLADQSIRTVTAVPKDSVVSSELKLNRPILYLSSNITHESDGAHFTPSYLTFITVAIVATMYNCDP